MSKARSSAAPPVRMAPTLDLDPSEAATQKFGIVGASGSGKSYTARRLVEQLFAAGAPVIILDPVGNWSWLRVAADGVSPGLAIPVLGGMRGDVSLELERGADLAGALVGADASAVIDVSEFSKGKRKGFVADFVEAMFQAARLHLSPIHLVVEEAQLFAPQHAQRGEERMLGAMTDWVRLARNYGGGVTLITQRPQSVSKEVLNQVECLFVGQLRGPHERKAIEGWATETGADAGSLTQADLKQLPSLEVGEFFCWSPSWLRRFERVRILKTVTYDGSKTPQLFKGGRLVPQERAPIDVAALRALMAPKAAPAPETAETSDDPKVLRKRIAELQRQLQGAESNGLSKHTAELAAARARAEELEKDLAATHAAQRARAVIIDELVEDLTRILSSLKTLTTARTVPELLTIQAPIARDYGFGVDGEKWPEPTPRETRPRKVNGAPAPTGESLGKCARALLAALLQHGDLSLQQAAIIAQYSPGSSVVRNSAGELRSLGLVSGSNSLLSATPEGRAHPDMRGVEPFPVGPALAQYWLSRLGKCEAVLLQRVLGSHPRPISLEQAARGTEYSPTSSVVRNSAGRLRTLMLVTGGNAGMTANERLV